MGRGGQAGLLSMGLTTMVMTMGICTDSDAMDLRHTQLLHSLRPQRRIPRAPQVLRSEQSLALALLSSSLIANLLIHDTRLANHTTPFHIHRLRIRRGPQLLPALHPHALQLRLDLRAALLPLLHLREPLAQLGEFLLDARFFRGRADALELPFLAGFAETQGEEVGVVALERGAGGDGDEC